MEARFCAACGTGVPAGAQFCPQCGTKVMAPVTPPVLPPPPVDAPASRRRSAGYGPMVWVPIALIGIALLGWAVLAGLPFRGPRSPRPQKLEVVQEAPAPTAPVTTTISEIRGPVEAEEENATVENRPPGEGTIGEADSVSILRGFIGSRAEYGVASECVDISSEGYRNRGYTLNARNRCEDSSLGRWRVDTLTGKVYLQRRDGRFLSP